MQFSNQYLKDFARQSVQQAEQAVAMYQAAKQCAGSMDNYTFFHEKQAAAKSELNHWQSFLDGCNQSIRVGSLIRPRTSAVRGVVLELGQCPRRKRRYAHIQTLGSASQAPAKYSYFLEDLQVAQPSGHDLQRIKELNLYYQPI